ncbi:hypothetical protein [Paenibacillus sp. MMS18-CY102]|uniref:hypothetical protein n=1 Tax=Paenibacillus sp. MMS18-CY102 TaxID=2682849 RepID=UPI001365E557|nr:hypothetical protein [Paenibacillus sp. MMS18-CY102]MWC26985.1 hypothetical protein [Paenibacillus sp. MMS18-CY102]
MNNINTYKNYYLGNLFESNKWDYKLINDIILAFVQDNDCLYYEQGYVWSVSGLKNAPNTVEDNVNGLWTRIDSREELLSLTVKEVVYTCAVLGQKDDFDTCKFKLAVIETDDSLELHVIEFMPGEFQKLLSGALKPFLDRGITLQ